MAELIAQYGRLSIDSGTIPGVEDLAGSPSPNNVIDTEAELNVLNNNFDPDCV